MAEKMIADKMYLKTAKSLAILNGEVNPGVVAQLPAALVVGAGQPAEVVLLFALNQAQLEALYPQALARLGEKGSLWVAYLKPAAHKATDLTRASVSAWAAQQGATSVATVSMDLDWSATRFKLM